MREVQGSGRRYDAPKLTAQPSQNRDVDGLEICLGDPMLVVKPFAVLSFSPEQVQALESYGIEHVALRPGRFEAEGGGSEAGSSLW